MIEKIRQIDRGILEEITEFYTAQKILSTLWNMKIVCCLKSPPKSVIKIRRFDSKIHRLKFIYSEKATKLYEL